MKWKELLEEIEKRVGKEGMEEKEISFIDFKKFSTDIAELRKKIFELELALVERQSENEKLKSKIAVISKIREATEYLAKKVSGLEGIVEKEFREKILQIEKKLNALSELLEEKVRSLTAEKFEVVMDIDKRLSFLEEQIDKLFATVGFVEKSRFLRELTERIKKNELNFSTLSQEFRKFREDLNKKLIKMRRFDEIKELRSEFREIRRRLDNFERRFGKVEKAIQKRSIEEIKIEEVAKKLVKKRELKKLKPPEILKKGVELLK